MLVSAQEGLGLSKNSFRNLINIFGEGMLALVSFAFPLLAEAYALGLLVDDVLLDGFSASTHDSLLAKIVLAVLGEEMLTGNFSDGWIQISSFF